MFAVIGAGAVATAFGVGPAQAAGNSTTINPSGAHAKAQNIGNVTIAVGSYTVTCTGLTSTGQVPVAPANHNASGPVAVAIGVPTFSGCSINAPFESVTVTANATNGAWSLSAQNGSPITGSLNIPKAGVTATISGLLNCSVVAAPTGPASVSGTFTNGTNSTTNPSYAQASSSVPLSITGGGCPTDTSGTIAGKIGVYDTDNTATAITVSK
ncbi:hypothetical protein EBN03_26490 [Nocardia stercoris]|uniref:Ig-like domain repeat protein n=1 Tax=Nocardia stercoris TaxID=2483361 RepID=A0A3M2KV03_9NOCA|nr:hypothetical protein EBN03_26490 [Nocardia stercoris]